MSAQPVQNIITEFIWGLCRQEDQKNRLVTFLNQCAHEHYVLSKKKPGTACSAADIASIISKIKSESPVPKSQLIPSSIEGSRGDAAVLDCVVRMMFMTATQTDYAVGGGSISFKWKNNETIVDFLDRVYSRVPLSTTSDQAINVRNLRAANLTRETGIQIKGTNKLSDHLHLIYGDDFKILLVFHQRSFLEFSLEILKDDRIDLDHSTLDALKCGCLQPQLLVETLQTLDLLFPIFGDKKSKQFLKDWVKRENLDTRLLDLKPSTSVFTQPPKDLYGLYEQYPYWGRQLSKLLREFDDPTPITWWQKYTERGRSPRRMFECAIAALVVTAFSALTATALAAVQVWITYCDWDGAPSRSWCSPKNGTKGK